MNFTIDSHKNVNKKEIFHNKPIIAHVGEFTDEEYRTFLDDFMSASLAGQSVFPVVIDSDGGDVYSMLGMADVIYGAKNMEVITICQSKAFSCGMFLFCCGSRRILTPNATIMLHDISAVLAGKYEDISANLREAARLKRRLMSIVSHSTGKGVKYYEKLLNTSKNIDMYWDAIQARSYGIATEIGYPSFNVKIDVNYSIEVQKI